MRALEPPDRALLPATAHWSKHNQKVFTAARGLPSYLLLEELRGGRYRGRMGALDPPDRELLFQDGVDAGSVNEQQTVPPPQVLQRRDVRLGPQVIGCSLHLDREAEHAAGCGHALHFELAAHSLKIVGG
jgi:hypothetical protein